MSGLVLPVPNKSHYPAEFRDKSRLTYYASLYNSIEINSSFYKIPKSKTIGKWSEMVPADFRFTFKVFREITHQKKLRYERTILEKFLESVAGAEEKKGCLLLQLPGGTKFDSYDQLGSLLEAVTAHPLYRGWRLAVEFRDPSWYMTETWELLNEFNTALVYQDMPKSVTPRVGLKAREIYLRYHGPSGNYRGSYARERLAGDADAIRKWLKAGKWIYAYFNNTLGEAGKNLAELNHLIKELNT